MIIRRFDARRRQPKGLTTIEEDIRRLRAVPMPALDQDRTRAGLENNLGLIGHLRLIRRNWASGQQCRLRQVGRRDQRQR
ncbi:hypothetical protein D3C86_2143690 [compost metagenome]